MSGGIVTGLGAGWGLRQDRGNAVSGQGRGGIGLVKIMVLQTFQSGYDLEQRMKDLVFELVIPVTISFIFGWLLTTKPTILIRLLTAQFDVNDTHESRSPTQENIFWARTDPVVWAAKYPVQVQLFKLGGYIAYSVAGLGALFVITDVFALLF